MKMPKIYRLGTVYISKKDFQIGGYLCPLPLACQRILCHIAPKVYTLLPYFFQLLGRAAEMCNFWILWICQVTRCGRKVDFRQFFFFYRM